MADQQFCLRWNNYKENLTRILDRLLQNEALVDVTLYVNGNSIRAHKTILSACSPYFEKMFMENTHPHPIVVLRDFNYGDIKGLLDFMYKGEVNISQDRLASFIKTAEILEVRGLSSDSAEKKPQPQSNQEESQVPAVKRRRHSSYDATQEDASHKSVTHHASSNLPNVSTQPSSSFTSSVPASYAPSPPSPVAIEPQPDPKSPIMKPEMPSPPPLVRNTELLAEPDTILPEEPEDHNTDTSYETKPVQISDTTAASSFNDNSGESHMSVVKEENIDEPLDDDEPELLEVYSNMDYQDQSSSSSLTFADTGIEGSPAVNYPHVEGTSSGIFCQVLSPARRNFQVLPDDRFLCNICSRVVKHSRHLSQHLSIHLPPRFTCDICGKKFNQRVNRDVHYLSVCHQKAGIYGPT